VKRAVAFLALFVGAQDPKPAPAVAPLYEKYLAERAALDPCWATDQGIHDHDDRLTRSDDATRDATIKLMAARLEELSKLDPEKLSVDERLDAALWKAQLETDLYDYRRRDERKIMPGIPLAAIYAIHSQLIKDFAPLEKRASQALARLKQIPEIFDEIRKRLDKPPRVWVEMAIDDASGVGEAIDEFARLMKPGLKDSEELSGIAKRARESVSAYVEFRSQPARLRPAMKSTSSTSSDITSSTRTPPRSSPSATGNGRRRWSSSKPRRRRSIPPRPGRSSSRR